ATPGGELVEAAPEVYQEIGGVRVPVTGRYVLLAEREVGFDLGSYDPHQPLVIDPTLYYSTFLSGNGDSVGQALTVDRAGNVYLTGYGVIPTAPGALQPSPGGGLTDGFVAKLSATGSTLIYSTYLGGSGYDFATGIAVDAAGNAYVAGTTTSRN